jgi:predicted molibdopterin-dependent oxidoreductase YjgC
MFKPLESRAQQATVSLFVEGREVQAHAGEMLATALLREGVHSFRQTPVSGSPRGPLCLMGVCFDCLVDVNGRPNVQACMTTVEAGMTVRLQHGARALKGPA